MSQQALATAVGVHVNTMARWESTGIEPDHPRLPSIAAVFHCPLEQLIGEPEHFVSSRRQHVPDWPASKVAIVARFVAAYRARLSESWQGQ